MGADVKDSAYRTNETDSRATRDPSEMIQDRKEPGRLLTLAAQVESVG
jgi:hypothetical protein